ncbi:MAG: maleylpyruvate isomerase family mycothiol-dependent enzyme [Dermatophilaceae bacterium]
MAVMVELTQIVETESARFLKVIRPVDPAARVPSCPEWSADDLLWHLTEVHAFWTGVLGGGALSDEEAEAVEAAAPARPEDRDALVRLYEESTAALLKQLRHREDAEPAYFWLDTARTVGSTRRMQAHEATMHRVDAELAAGTDPGSSDPALAADGIAHVVDVMWAWWSTQPGFAFTPQGGVVTLVATDTGGDAGGPWSLQPGRWRGTGQSGRGYDEPGVVMAEEGAEAVAEVSGTVNELYRWLWGRAPEPATSGDPRALDALREAQAKGVQ